MHFKTSGDPLPTSVQTILWPSFGFTVKKVALSISLSEVSVKPLQPVSFEDPCKHQGSPPLFSECVVQSEEVAPLRLNNYLAY